MMCSQDAPLGDREAPEARCSRPGSISLIPHGPNLSKYRQIIEVGDLHLLVSDGLMAGGEGTRVPGW